MKSDDLEQFWEQVLSKELGEGKGETGNKYARILESAIKIFSKKGFAGSRTSEIAKSADVAEGTIFRYFPKKDDILMEMILDVHHVLLELAHYIGHILSYIIKIHIFPRF